MPDVKRYTDKTLAPLQAHTSPDVRSKSLGDIDINNPDGTCFESLEIKYNKPITADMIYIACQKFRSTTIDRYYILTTHSPEIKDEDSVTAAIQTYRQQHSCQVIVNGVVPSLKYYLRLITFPAQFIQEYTNWLQYEYERGSGIKKQHLQVWQTICEDTF